MAKNLEIKVKIPSFTPFLAILNKKGIKQKEVLHQKDIYYKTGNVRLKLRIENENERAIYYSRAEAGGTDRFSDYELLEISSGNGESFFNKLFTPEIIVEKERILYIIGDTRIHLDNVKKLGTFLELETVVTRDENSAKEEFNKIVNWLDLNSYEEYRNSYSDLMAK